MSSSDKPSTSRLVSSKSVNAKIIEYYLKYAKDRDIEKFMRFSSSQTSRCASSDEYECVIEFDANSDRNLKRKNTPVEKPANREKSPIPEDLSVNSPVRDRQEQLTAPDSIKKNAKNAMEWDSMADVGYKKSSSTGNLSSLERSVLRELFSESTSETNISRNLSNEAGTSSILSSKQKARREKWRETLENLGKKYSSLSANLDTQEFTEQPQSTPKILPNAEKSCQTTFDMNRRKLGSNSRIKDHSCQTSFDERFSRRSHKSDAKYSQTSLAKIKSQEVQANISSRAGSFATQSSFEFQPGESDSSSSLLRRSILSENNSAESSKSRQSFDSDKENKLVRKPGRPHSEVDLGIKLLCSLIDAKNLSGTQKKKLAKKIFEKIMKQQTSASTSTSLTSRSPEFSVRSLIDSSPPQEAETNRSDAIPAPQSKIIQQVSEETQTDEPKEDDKRPSTCSSQEEPVTMREWLHPLTRSEKDYDKKLKKQAAHEISPQTSERQKQLSWIETEINRLEGLKNLLIQESPSKSRSNSSKSTNQSGSKAEVIYEETAEDVVNSMEQYKRTTRKTSQNVVIYDEPNTDDGKQPEKVEYKSTHVVIAEEHYGSSSSSPKNHRSKLETPVSSSSPVCDDSVSAFANQLQKQFMENYAKKERCTSEHYSEPRVRPKPIFTRNPSYTSVASSPFCMSSEMSIPIVESSSTSTTTHQYDSHGCDSVEGVAVQTSYSIIKTDPIFGPRCTCICKCGTQCKCSCPRPTVRVSGQAFHQTVQVKPKALAYVIRFSETCDSDGNKVTEESLSLQQRLESHNPDFCSKANERREILKKLHNLRQEREQRIREIAECSSVSSISTKLQQLPPPAIKQVRICPTKEMKNLTKRRYCKLQEVVAKQEREKLEKRKKATRILTHIFNKKLQRMVHKGKMSLEYSRTVI